MVRLEGRRTEVAGIGSSFGGVGVGDHWQYQKHSGLLRWLVVDFGHLVVCFGHSFGLLVWQLLLAQWHCSCGKKREGQTQVAFRPPIPSFSCESDLQLDEEESKQSQQNSCENCNKDSILYLFTV